MEEMSVHALDYLSVLQRRKWWLIAPAGGVRVRGARDWCATCRREYRSSTRRSASRRRWSRRISSIPRRPFDNEERLRAISQQLLSVPILDRVVQEEKLASSAPKDVQIG